jgi:prevent-host-death family protein
MAETVSVTQMKAQFSKLAARAAAGEVITITKRGIPVATLEPLPNGFIDNPGRPSVRQSDVRGKG